MQLALVQATWVKDLLLHFHSCCCHQLTLSEFRDAARLVGEGNWGAGEGNWGEEQRKGGYLTVYIMFCFGFIFIFSVFVLIVCVWGWGFEWQIIMYSFRFAAGWPKSRNFARSLFLLAGIVSPGVYPFFLQL